MKSPDSGVTAQASVCDLESVKAGQNPAGMVVRLNKLIASLSVGGVPDTGWLGCGHARPVNFINNEVGSALLWRWWRLYEALWVLVLTHDYIDYGLDHLR